MCVRGGGGVEVQGFFRLEGCGGGGLANYRHYKSAMSLPSCTLVDKDLQTGKINF